MSKNPTIYYICFVPPKTGGEQVNLHSVATLCQQGVRAVALCNLDADPKLSDVPAHLPLPLEPLQQHRQFNPEDIVVIPEFYREAFAHFATQPCQRVIHIQGPFLSFRGFDSIEQLNAHGFLSGITCSRFGKALMEKMGAKLNWQVVTPTLHPLFTHRQSSLKKNQIAYMPDKRPKEAPVIRALFQAKYPEFRAIPWIPMIDMSRQRCAEIMAESTVFASLSYLEGLGLPPLESMASDCLVCGFDGLGGSDYASEENGLWVQEGDHDGFTHALAEALRRVNTGDAAFTRQIKAGQQTAQSYNQERFSQELCSAWQNILGERWINYRNTDPT
ncbi:MAG: glycosyltransferase [Pseudomonadota bacterium]